MKFFPETILELVDEIPPDYPDATGAQLLWQPELTRLYVNLLKETSSEDIVEATLGALQNLTYGIWKVKYALIEYLKFAI